MSLSPQPTRLLHGCRVHRRSYRRELVTPMVNARQRWDVRKGFFLKLQSEDSSTNTAFAEIAPLPSMGSESFEEADSFLRQLPKRITPEAWPALLHAAPPACAFGMATAASPPPVRPDPVRTAALLGPVTADDTPSLLPSLRARGFDRFKCKLTHPSPDTTIPHLEAFFEALRPGEKLRLDANRAWEEHSWNQWLEHLAPFADFIEFLEEPLAQPPPPKAYAAMASQSPVPLALDESLLSPPTDPSVAAGDAFAQQLDRWLEAGWPGWFICKPALCGDPAAWLPLLQSAAAQRTVLSSAMESAIGLQAVLAVAQSFPPNCRHGLDTSYLFTDGCGLPRRQAALNPLPQERLTWIWQHCPS